jgi:hypothetical protein
MLSAIFIEVLNLVFFMFPQAAISCMRRISGPATARCEQYLGTYFRHITPVSSKPSLEPSFRIQCRLLDRCLCANRNSTPWANPPAIDVAAALSESRQVITKVRLGDNLGPDLCPRI